MLKSSMSLLVLASSLLRFKLEGIKIKVELFFQYKPGIFCRYYNIDALDSDLPALQSLQALRLYRNYICR